MNKKITELLKLNSYTYKRDYKLFVPDDWGDWENVGVFGNAFIKEGYIRSFCTGYTASASLPSPSSRRIVKGLRKAKSIRINFIVYYTTLRGWYIREQPDAYMRLLGGYIMMRCGGNGSYISVGDNVILNTANNARYDTTFYQRYLICNGIRHDYPDNVRLKYATSDEVYGYAYGGFITSNDYFQCYSDLYIDNFTVVHTT